jgi:ubiquinol-cytochrome c reductase cytochrome c1 subunit
MTRALTLLLALLPLLGGAAPEARAAGTAADPPPALSPALRDPLLRPDNAARRRGLEVFQQACAACHGLRHLPYRELGRLGLSAAQIREVASARTIPVLDADGQPTERPATASDPWTPPWPNEAAGRAQHNGALPIDLSLITKARKDGAAYVAALLQGYADPPPGEEVAEGQWYNRHMEGRRIAMPPPLVPEPGQISHADGTESTQASAARDVAAFLDWVAEPAADDRLRVGLWVLLYLAVALGLARALQARIRRRVLGQAHAP